MKLNKNMLSILAAVGLTIGGVGTVSADCVGFGKVVYLVEDGTTATATIAILAALPTTYYSFTTTNQGLKNQLSDALSNHYIISYVSNGTDCTILSPGAVKPIGMLTVLRTRRNG